MARYTDIKTKHINNPNGTRGIRYYSTTKYPQVPKSFSDTYVYAEEGDRYDQLALQYYGDPSLWWVISIANETLNQNSYFAPLGVQIRIPSNISNIISQYNKLNNSYGS
tara:strand:+ start:1437 stop:1763 length:327 start_codon:yes stop_codon:yes gene_type:complete